MIEIPWNTVVNAIQVIVGAATVGALIFTAKTFLKTRKTNQLGLVEGVFKDVRNLETELRNIPPEDEDQMRNWRSVFFNTLEWFAFLINENYVKDPKMIGFWKPAILDWYRNIFLKFMNAAIDNPNEFPEFKKLCHRLERES